ncbi:Tar ligand binding domain-containing protein [Providencia alcalifaciens]|uniref:Tar ligand binding domain-containing protein n=1 Tax=Providencia alcalifaciens TaxID=126385 RepID=UPI001E414F91
MLGKNIRISVSLYLLLILFCGMQLTSSGVSVGIVNSELNALERIDMGSKKRALLEETSKT